MLLKPISCAGCPLYEPPYGKHEGFSVPDGNGSSGIAVIAEALGEQEEQAGIALVGKSGYALFQNLARVDIKRDGLTLFNVIACKPPNNKLIKTPYEITATTHCAPNLDRVLAEAKATAIAGSKNFVVITLGQTAFRRVLWIDAKDNKLKEDSYAYPFWSDHYQAWILNAPHPAYLLRGNNHLWPIVQFVFKRALEIAENGLTLDKPEYLLDPLTAQFSQWVKDYKDAYQRDPENTFLSYDIETPHKQGKDEEKVAKEEDDDYTILRCSFSYRPGQAVSVPWQADQMPMFEELFGHPGGKVGWNSSLYDDPRIKAQMPMNGDSMDGMLAWHVLNSSLPKGLGFVTPFYVQNTSMWKHLSSAEPAFYNAKDADMALRNWLGIRRDLQQNNLWHVFDRHVTQMNRVFQWMSEKGVLRDEVMRGEAETKLTGLLNQTEAKMKEAVPQEARRLKVYKKTPKDTTGMIQVERVMPVKRCSVCGLLSPKKAHFKPVSAKKLKLGLDNVCEDAEVVARDEPVILWAKPLEFKVSLVGMLGYQKALRHQAIVNRKEEKITFDESAIENLIKRYPSDPLYPLILQHREYGKLLGTYIGVTKDGIIHGGMPTGIDGRIHAQYTHNPSTLRIACQQPNMQNVPRARGVNDLQTIVRNLIIASPDHVLLEFDFSAIEAVLVGFFACSADYIRLSKLGIHSFLASHVLGRPADLKWSDEDLKEYFKEIKKSQDQHVQDIYNSSKRTTHLSGYGGTPTKMHLSEPEAFPTIKDAERLQRIYFEVCPYIKSWHKSVQLQAEKDGYLRNPFNYIHRFSRVFTYTKIGGKWEKNPGDDANKVLAFLPQSTAAAIIKEVMLRLYFSRFEEAGQYLRLQIHDSLLSEVPLQKLEEVKYIKKEEMTKPIPELRLPASYGLGEMLCIDVESKQGTRWGSLS